MTEPSPALKVAELAHAGQRTLSSKQVSSLRGLRLPFGLAAALISVELVIAHVSGLSIFPFIACAVICLGLILYFFTGATDVARRWGRVLTVFLLLKTLAVFVGVTGGARSQFSGLLYLPIFLSALYFGLAGGVAAGAAVCLALWFITLYQPRPEAFTPLLAQCAVFAVVSLAASLFAERLRGAAFAASRRESVQIEKVDRFRWFTETVVMMESLHDLDYMLSVALLRVRDLLPCNSAVIYLRDGDDAEMTLKQTMGVEEGTVEPKSIPASRQEPLRNQDRAAIFVADTSAPSDPLFPAFASVDRRAGSVIIVPLRTLDDLFGVVYVAASAKAAFRRSDCDNLIQFSKHIVYPIQRVRLQTMAATDALTGLNNRRAFRTRLRDEVERAERYRHPLSLVLIDIDHFKRVNDSLGHRSGDAILSQIGAIMRRVSRGIDFAARYGGEEIAVLCPESSMVDALTLAERIRTTVVQTEFQLADGGTTRITVSAGVACLGETVRGEAALVESADRALYRAKSLGRNRTVSADPAD
jgi:diguanylate cyclase (GGDEF)-like protein